MRYDLVKHHALTKYSSGQGNLGRGMSFRLQPDDIIDVHYYADLVAKVNPDGELHIVDAMPEATHVIRTLTGGRFVHVKGFRCLEVSNRPDPGVQLAIYEPGMIYHNEHNQLMGRSPQDFAQDKSKAKEWRKFLKDARKAIRTRNELGVYNHVPLRGTKYIREELTRLNVDENIGAWVRDNDYHNIGLACTILCLYHGTRLKPVSSQYLLYTFNRIMDKYRVEIKKAIGVLREKTSEDIENERKRAASTSTGSNTGATSAAEDVGT